MIHISIIGSVPSNNTFFEVLISSRNVQIGLFLIFFSWVCELVRISYKLDHWLQHEKRMQSNTVRRRNEVELEKLSPHSRNRIFDYPTKDSSKLNDISPSINAYEYFIPDGKVDE